MAKFPSQKLMTYDTPNLSNDSLQDCGVLNIPKDLSILNRRGYASTTRKGVPLLFRTRFTLYSMNRLGTRPALDADAAGSTSDDAVAETIMADDLTTLLRVSGCQNNWVMRNAAIKWHAAREEMFRKSGVTKKQRGAYAHEIRYNYDAADDSYMTPVDQDGADFTGGTWDVSRFVVENDDDFQLKLVGQGVSEASAFSGAAQQIGYSYLVSRSTVAADSNLESSSLPVEHSTLRELLAPSPHASVDDHVVDEAQDKGDNPPYDQVANTEINHDITEPVLLGQGVTSMTTPVASFICDIPFGLAKIQARHSGATDQNIVDPVFFTAEVLKISEMQG